MRITPTLARLAWLGVLLPLAPLGAAEPPPPADAVTVEGGRYFGPLVDGRLHGRGRIEWGNGARYEGEFAEGLLFGRGRLLTAAGQTYEGEFRQGLMEGKGRLEDSDGSVYVGEFSGDLMHGEGRLETPQGEVYEGRFEKGRFEGTGRYTDDEAAYTGEFRDWRFEGQGELRYADGRKYRGAFVRGLFEGMGRYETPDGEIYEGEFIRGDFTGEGRYIAANGGHHEGRFADWRPHGPGRYVDPAGNVYEGHFENGQLNGPGRLTGKDGTRYEGEFARWRFHGRGALRHANGDLYEGHFASGLYEGDGTLTYATAQADGRTQDSGAWRHGRLVDEESERLARLQLEAALYAERELLGRSLESLRPQDPDAIDLYLVAVAGDASQEVFRREVEFVREQFDDRFGTRGRSAVLINSRSTLGTVPIATRTSLREALRAVGNRMDREQDILFLFLTSHGSEEHELTLDQRHLALPDLPAGELRGLLDESGIRWRVVLVSACYSGGFIGPLKDDHTLIITAARHDRRSFGCSDDNDFTYFGRAFFQNALPGSNSFEEAFHKAETQIKAWELADLQKVGRPDPEHFSLPQMHGAPAIREHLRRWWTERASSRQPMADAAAGR